MTNTSLKFHWSLPIDGEKERASAATVSGVPDIESMIEFCREAENQGLESLLMPFGFHMPDPISLVAHLSQHTSQLKLLIAYRAGIISPTLFVQQINTLSHLAQGRIAINFIAGTSPSEQARYGDFASHDQRLERCGEFMSVCQQLWRASEPVDFAGQFIKVKQAQIKTPFFEGKRPTVYLSGNSQMTEQIATKNTDGWLRYADSPSKIKASLQASKSDSLSVGLRMSLIARETKEEALRAAYEIVSHPDLQWKEFVQQVVNESDSEAVKKTFALAAATETAWLTPHVWTGAVPFRGGPAVAIVGSYDEVAGQIMDFKAAGVNEFIFSGWPNRTELKIFSEQVLPRIRRIEQSLNKESIK